MVGRRHLWAVARSLVSEPLASTGLARFAHIQFLAKCGRGGLRRVSFALSGRVLAGVQAPLSIGSRTSRSFIGEAVDRPTPEAGGFVPVSLLRQAEAERDSARLALQRVRHEERLRIARDLHDRSGQTTVLLRLGLQALGKKLSSAEDVARLDRLHKQVDELANDLHRITASLRPAGFDSLGLATMLRILIEDWGRETGVKTAFSAVGPVSGLDPVLQTTLFHIAQEALTNVSKHALTASIASIMLQCTKTEVVLTVYDDGVGLAHASRHLSEENVQRRSYGLVGMSERLALVGGQLSIVSGPSVGTKISACISIGDGLP